MNEIELVEKLLRDNDWSLSRTYEAIQEISPCGSGGGVGFANAKRASYLYRLAKELIADRNNIAMREHMDFERILENPLCLR